jgi:hypothetical protein
MELRRQLIATDGNSFPPILSRFAADAFATGCHRLRPLGSIKAPSLVVHVGYIAPRE